VRIGDPRWVRRHRFEKKTSACSACPGALGWGSFSQCFGIGVFLWSKSIEKNHKSEKNWIRAGHLGKQRRAQVSKITSAIGFWCPKVPTQEMHFAEVGWKKWLYLSRFSLWALTPLENRGPQMVDLRGSFFKNNRVRYRKHTYFIRFERFRFFSNQKRMRALR